MAIEKKLIQELNKTQSHVHQPGCSHHHTGHNPLFCVVPPHIVECVMENGNDSQRQNARALMNMSAEFRGNRMGFKARRRRRIAQRLRGLGEAWGRAAAAFEANRCVYDAENGTRLPGTKVREEGDPESSDVSVNEAYDGLGATFDLFAEEYGRNSIDDNGMKLEATVHFGVDFDNAFWNGRQMVFGDGMIFNRFTASLDVISHELTHGVTENSAGLVYFVQPGALNESVSDVFGVLAKQRVLGQTAAEADWLVGKELFDGTSLQGDALRSMKDPGTAYDDPLIGKDPQPGHMDDYVRTASDNGGVHINSGIPNKAFYLAATSIGGNAWEEAGTVWYEALTGPYTRAFTQFRGFAIITIITAAQLYGFQDDVTQAILDAWRQVGVL